METAFVGKQLKTHETNAFLAFETYRLLKLIYAVPSGRSTLPISRNTCSGLIK